jgi:hypothetical protein
LLRTRRRERLVRPQVRSGEQFTDPAPKGKCGWRYRGEPTTRWDGGELAALCSRLETGKDPDFRFAGAGDEEADQRDYAHG